MFMAYALRCFLYLEEPSCLHPTTARLSAGFSYSIINTLLHASNPYQVSRSICLLNRKLQLHEFNSNPSSY